jgi:archaellum biogenesis protein FlaJ (TadC family)
MSGRKQVVEAVENPRLLTRYVNFLYTFLGRPLLKNSKSFRRFFHDNLYTVKYEQILKQANLKLMPEEYFLSIFLTLALTFGLMVISSIIFFFIYPVYALFIFYGGLILIFILGLMLYNYPIVVSKQRGVEIDAAIPYLLPYMKILSRELNLSKIIELIDDFLIYREVREEFRKIKYYSHFLGYDIHTSIRESMLSCPSRQLSDLMNDLVTISNSGGDIYGYLERKLNNLQSEIDAIETKNIETLLIYSQIYVVLLLISPLFFTILSVILNLVQFGSDTGAAASSGSSFTTILMMIFFLPFAYFGFMFLVYFSKPLYSRLSPVGEKKK